VTRRIAVVLAGGGGTRLWPASTPDRPKQLMDPLLSGTSLLRQTIERVADLVDETWIVTTRDQAGGLGALARKVDRVIAEPAGRNTAPAVALAVRHAESLHGEATLIALPADHHVADPEEFRRHLAAACVHAEADLAIATLGISPDYPATGFGYIERSAEALPPREGDDGVTVYEATRFVEKPDLASAERFVQSGRFLWNAGVFVMPRERIADELARHCPAVWSALEPIVAALRAGDAAAAEGIADGAYAAANAAPIDTAVMEKLGDIRVVPASVGWTDLGSWQAIYELAAKDPRGNASVTGGPTPVLVDSDGSLVWSESAQIAVLGLKDVVVVQSGDRVLVMSRAEAQRVRAVVDALKARDEDG
jgi:mannose-1-phosphate guanylyltransferase